MNKEDLFGYSVNLLRLSEEDGGGWLAEVPELKGCLADGNNPEEALKNLKDVVDTWLEVAREDSKKIPEPRIYVDSEYSGKFTLRIPKTLHRQLVYEAEKEGVSLNQLVLSMISYNWGQMTSNIDNDTNTKQLQVQKTFTKITYTVPDESLVGKESLSRGNPFNYQIIKNLD